MKCRFNFCLILALIILSMVILFNFEKGSGYYTSKTKRGYILDRKGEPLVVNKESFQAFYLIQGRNFIGRDFPEEIKPYLPKLLDLPEKGLILLSEKLTLDEIEKLSKVKNVTIKGNVERKILYEGLEPIIGITTGDRGISGIEKALEGKLLKGESILISLDAHFMKKIYNLTKMYPSYNIKGIAQFDLKTGELISYYSKDKKEWLTLSFPIHPTEGIKIPEVVKWELGEYRVAKIDDAWYITPLHLISAYFYFSCGKVFFPTVLVRQEVFCSEIAHRGDELFYLISDNKDFSANKRWFFFYPTGETLFVATGEMEQDQSVEMNWNYFKENLKYMLAKVIYG